MAPATYDIEFEPKRIVRPSLFCTLFWHKKKTTEFVPNHFLVECERCNEAIEMFGTVTFTIEVPAPTEAIRK
jgi:hypothetical protein